MHKLFLTILFAALVLAWETPVAAQEEEPTIDGDTRRCLMSRSIRRTRVVDDRNLLFYVSGRDVYHNILRRPCNGLEREGRFSYKTSAGGLCSTDMIYVLYDDAFGGLREGPGCRLGIFHRITREDATAMIEGKDAKIESEPLPMPEPEEVGADEEPEEPEEPHS